MSSQGRELTPDRHAPRFPFPAALEDIQAGLATIREYAQDWGVDLARLGVIGWSAGAHLAMLLAYGTAPSPFRAVVNFYGPVDLVTAYEHPPIPDPIQTRSVLTAFLGGSLAQVPERYREASPVQAVRRAVPGQIPPTLMFYGRRDHIVQPQYGQQLRDALGAHPSPAYLIELPWADHAFDAVFRGIHHQMALYYLERFLAAQLFP